jgi:hypothetical protein
MLFAPITLLTQSDFHKGNVSLAAGLGDSMASVATGATHGG